MALDPGPSRPPAPLSLARHLLGRTLLLVLLTLLAAVGVTLLRVAQSADVEGRGALALASAMIHLLELETLDDTQAIQRLQDPETWQVARSASGSEAGALRHLQVRVTDARGQLLHAEGGSLDRPPGTGAPTVLVDVLMALSRRLGPSTQAGELQWSLARPNGAAWTVTLVTSPDSEQREEAENALIQAVVLAVCVLGLVAVLALVLRGALRPLQRMMGAVTALESGSTRALAELPRLPVSELDALSQALRHLAQALDEAQDRRRHLARQVLTLQEDERQHLARELHDEFGQRLTALRADAAWLMRKLESGARAGRSATQAATPEEALEAMRSVVSGVARQLELIQQDVRGVLRRLQPLPMAQAHRIQDLVDALDALIRGWTADGARDLQGHPLAIRFELDLPPDLASRRISQDLMLTIYRISQEGLTNVLRHASASQATLGLRVSAGDPADGDTALHLDWSVHDDGRGIPDLNAAMARGNGLAGLKERVWAQGSDLIFGGHDGNGDHQGHRGLQLRARFPVPADAAGFTSSPATPL